ncbi:AAA-ATPase [Quillaja saponaria]|uniref:AAA-ATPase n=1 Tax=Quillaja saponaria TaxID=32244 RepID=A0AAD7PXD9_QUISA|nr:AAA-ATPase [Quillaja saponaria]
MIAAMANFLNYDVYDLELTAVKDNTELRKLLINTSNKSIIPIEDIDCSLDLTGQRTEKKEKDEGKEDKDLVHRKVEEEENKVRRGRMDKHIELSYCCFEAFKVLAKNYLEIDSHHPFDTIRKLLKETDMTPANIAENLMPKSVNEDEDACLGNLIEALELAKEEAKKKAEEEDENSVQEDVKSNRNPVEDVNENGTIH